MAQLSIAAECGMRNAECGMRNAEKVADVIIDIQIRRQGHVRYATA